MGRVHKVVLGCVAGALALLAGSAQLPAASAQGGMRCGQKLVTYGDPQYRVRALCGEPEQIIQKVETRALLAGGRYTVVTGQNFLYGQRIVQVLIEEWIYDFGPNKFVRRVRFEDGQLVATTTEHYGVKRN
jgi:hypothetical protein